VHRVAAHFPHKKFVIVGSVRLCIVCINNELSPARRGDELDEFRKNIVARVVGITNPGGRKETTSAQARASNVWLYGNIQEQLIIKLRRTSARF
jgi:hypothetical protein